MKTINSIDFKITAILVICCSFLLSCEKDVIYEEEPSLKSIETDNNSLNGDRYIIVFRNEVFDEQKLKQAENYFKSQQVISTKSREILESAGLVKINFNHVYSNSIRGVSAKLDNKQVILLKNDKNIKYVEKDRYELLAPPCGTKKGGPCKDGSSDKQQIPYGITRVGGVSNYNGSGVAWIIDSGIDIDHPDLNVDIYRGYRAPQVAPFLLESPFDDDNGHGTHVAGTIGAINNDFGVIGVAPGATVIPVKVLGENGYGWWSDIIAGIDYVAANGKPGDVANLSIGGGKADAVDEAVVAASGKGIWFVIAAGNNGSDANNYSPARTNGDFVITVSAMDEADNWASFSNYGNPPIDYVAPGVYVNSTNIGGTYSYMSGTSMAAPHAAGVILLAGMPGTDGTFVKGDSDGNPDRVIYFNDHSSALPEAKFTYETNFLVVQFTDKSTDSDGSITAWNWNFGDGNSSSSQNPSHTYATGGTYSVSLTVTDDAGSIGSISQNITVSGEEVNSPPIAGFSYSTNLLAAQFTDTSTDADGSITAWSWNFGDGNSSSSQNPSHTYATGGTYIVSLTVTDDAGNTGSISKDITVIAEEPEPGEIVLSATGYKVKGAWHSDLTWSPTGTSAKVDIYRNGTFLKSVDNTGSYTDATNFKGGGSLNYKICEAGTTTCSNEATVQF